MMLPTALSLEGKKMKRIGFLPLFAGGGVLAALVPVLDMAFRGGRYMGLPGSPVEILLGANWQMMAMLNILLALTGACIMYHTEYADNGMLRMTTLPLRESSLFFNKLLLLSAAAAFMLLPEAASIAFCAFHWFGKAAGPELAKNFGYFLLLMLPGAAVCLLLSSLCKNMWASLGIGVICVFMATMLPSGNFALSLFPFALPFRTLTEAQAGGPGAGSFLSAAAAELFVIGFAECICIRIRRFFL